MVTVEQSEAPRAPVSRFYSRPFSRLYNGGDWEQGCGLSKPVTHPLPETEGTRSVGQVPSSSVNDSLGEDNSELGQNVLMIVADDLGVEGVELLHLGASHFSLLDQYEGRGYPPRGNKTFPIGIFERFFFISSEISFEATVSSTLSIG